MSGSCLDIECLPAKQHAVHKEVLIVESSVPARLATPLLYVTDNLIKAQHTQGCTAVAHHIWPQLCSVVFS